jgi:hypothetical protein
MATRPSRSLLFSLLLAACAGDVGSYDEVEIGDEDPAHADGSSELRVRASDTSLWVRTHLARESRDGVDTFVLRGRASRNIEDGRGYVFDDVYGQFARTAPRSFELAWTAGESRSMLHGVDQFIGVTFAPSASRPQSLTARVVVRPRLTGYSGSGLYLVYSVRAVVSGGRVVYRVQGHANHAITSLSADAAGVDIPDYRIDGDEFTVDLLEDHVLALASTRGQLSLHATLANGSNVVKRASLVLAVSKLGLTSEDAYETWPPPSCTDEVRACIAAVPAGSTDLGHCGYAVDVLQCSGRVGVTVDDVAIVAALEALGERLATSEARADAEALVGADRADAWLEGANANAQHHLEQQYGRVYPDAASRDAALRAAAEEGIDAAYATPLDLVEPFAPIPGDAERARHVAADALLAHLAEQDFASTELGRPLIELARVFRARHVESLRAFRTSIDPVNGLAPDSDAYVGDWIGLYTEVELDRATQAVTRVLVEID